MKRIKDFLDFLDTLFSAWKIILPIIVFGFSVILAVSKIGNQNISLNLPVWAIIAVAALALYPPAKLIEYLVRERKTPKIELYGLLWKPNSLSFLTPKPLCPHDDCGRSVICKIIPPNPFKVVSSISEINNTKFENRYIYECPIHGKISNVPNEEISLLQEKVKMAISKK
jgi:hypothetical protein